MNSVHDMGGMHGMGPLQIEKDEPVFHAPWEGRVFALNLATRAGKKWNIDAGRHEIELLPAADYLRMSYYEKWFARLEKKVVKTGMVTESELASGRPAPDSPKSTPPLTADQVPGILRTGALASRDVKIDPRFAVGQQVRARNINPIGHTRLPRYARGKTGVIDRNHGVYVFPDTNAHFQGENPQHVYSVRFTARELWGPGASPRDSVYLDLWDNYLEPA
ncbi:MAG TPA: nitrile hydratase subunit beta [Bryobacteraceae bacterium]|nr:nitrile hydratase subunit beta [Bryobacteraceae bacterium]